jgi:hypothetical protein
LFPRPASDIPSFYPSATATATHLNAGSRGGAEHAEKKKSSASESLRASAPPREYSDLTRLLPPPPPPPPPLTSIQVHPEAHSTRRKRNEDLFLEEITTKFISIFVYELDT